MINYREATKSDVFQFVDLAQTMAWESSEYRDIEFERDIVAQNFFTRFYSRTGVIFIAERNTRMIGFITGKLTPYLFSSAKQVSEESWYVLPDFRGGMVGPKLLKYLQEWGVKQGARETIVAPGIKANSERITRLLEKMGFQQSGYVLRKGI